MKTLSPTEEGFVPITDESLYGRDAKEWLQRWDKGEIVHTIEMGGLGPGYEQVIHIVCAEVLRHLLEEKYDASKWGDAECSKKDSEKIDEFMHTNPIIKKLGISGAQHGAAKHLAGHIYRRGPIAVMKDEEVKDRHIMVQKNFPNP